MALARRLVPMAGPLSRGRRRLLLVVLTAILGLVALTALCTIHPLARRPTEAVLRDGVSSAVYALLALAVALRACWVRDGRGAWSLLAAGVAAYAAGNVLWSTWIGHLAHPPNPSVCDGLWLAFYPLSYVGIVGLVRMQDDRRLRVRALLDGVVAGAGLAAIGAAIVFDPVARAAHGDPLHVGAALAYPIGDLLLAALVVGSLELRGWRLGRQWRLLGAGFGLLAVGDCLFALGIGRGGAPSFPATNLLYTLAIAALALGAWQPAPSAPRHDVGRSVLRMPVAFTLAAVGLFQYDHVHRLDTLTFALADLTVLAALVRAGLAVRDIRGLAEARRQALTDELTGLPNRRALMDVTRAAIERSQVRGGGSTLIVIDLDNFKELNDTLGHLAGDELLRLVGPRLRAVLRDADTVVRLGGDEFAVLLDGCGEPGDAERLALTLLARLRTPFEIRGLTLQLTAGLGLATFPADGADEHELLAHAEVAMYEAKRERLGPTFYARERDTHSPARLSLAADLARAIENEELEVHFQPKADARTRAICGAEALVRWRRSDGRLVPPDEFVSAAEQAGLSRPLTTLVLRAALSQAAAWRQAGLTLHVAVNTTVSDLLDLAFPTEVAGELAAAGLDPGALVLEVTESSVLSDPERIGVVLAELGELGVLVALDDFGTGYSSLSHLIRLPVGELKIDRSFVRDLRERPADAAIVGAMARLARELGMRVVAEGVEDDATWAELVRMGCDIVQGYGLSRPRPAAELAPLLGLPASAPASAPATA